MVVFDRVKSMNDVSSVSRLRYRRLSEAVSQNLVSCLPRQHFWADFSEVSVYTSSMNIIISQNVIKVSSLLCFEPQIVLMLINHSDQITVKNQLISNKTRQTVVYWLLKPLFNSANSCCCCCCCHRANAKIIQIIICICNNIDNICYHYN